jgi:mono/diheme cytochrome c family protein
MSMRWSHDATRVVLLIAFMSAPGGAAYAQGQNPLTPLQVERTERLLENRIACRGCHVIAGEGGAIGPVLDGIAGRAELDYVRSMIANPGLIPGSVMPHQPMSEGDRDRLARYVHQQASSAAGSDTPTPQAPPALSPGEEDDGDALYARHCAACHGEAGQGDGWNAARLPVQPTRHADPALMSLRADDTLYDGIAAGGYVLDRSARMPAYGDLLSDAQIRALVAHIRTLCACSQPAWAGGGG